ncbi:MAG: succinate dehydrogenase [Hyphomicrobiaceae bacterium]|nr:succinate dehydrogenase [Hyphomicrobiaceae bacterium]
MTLRLYVLQRLSAALMVPLIVGHLVVIFYATANGLSAAEILGRTRGSFGWALFYGVFVVLAAVHGAIGVRTVLHEWTTLRPAALDVLMWGFGLLLAVLGARAVIAVVMP